MLSQQFGVNHRKNFSQWERSFLWKLRCHWLIFLRRVAKTFVIQGPADPLVFLSNPQHISPYMRQWMRSALVQTKACRPFGAKPLCKPMLNPLPIGPLGISFSEIFMILFIHKNAYENIVFEMAVILSRGGRRVWTLKWVHVYFCHWSAVSHSQWRCW